MGTSLANIAALSCCLYFILFFIFLVSPSRLCSPGFHSHALPPGLKDGHVTHAWPVYITQSLLTLIVLERVVMGLKQGPSESKPEGNTQTLEVGSHLLLGWLTLAECDSGVAQWKLFVREAEQSQIKRKSEWRDGF